MESLLKGCVLNLFQVDTYLMLQGESCIASKEVGQVLRILGQNPTEDDIVDMVMKVRHHGNFVEV